MPVILKIKLNKKLFLRDPEQSELGRRIVSQSVRLIEKLGFENFTFKKLASAIGSTEASVYRYFENKHKLLVYLVSWYWAWLEHQIDYKTNNIEDAQEKLRIIIRIIAESGHEDPAISHIDESLLHKIVVAEASKSYLTKKVDSENREGFFTNYSLLCHKIASVIQRINPHYPYPLALASNMIETAHEQIFFAQHLPKLTDLKIKKNNYSGIISFLEHMAFSVIR